MRRYSQDIPWVLVREAPLDGFIAACEVCSIAGPLPDAQAVRDFAYGHARHAAPRGSFRLGDAVERMAKPVAALFGQAAPCTPCEARRRALNRFGGR